jgi:dephospho-CoA kinase
VSTFPGKYVIGLTGNIATGKSVVRRMLEHLGAYTIDADSLAHRAIAKGAPGYAPVLDTFGKWMLDSQGQIDREKLGGLVFRDPEAMNKLEAIVHPIVGGAVELLVQRAKQKVVVVEAIKLLESELRTKCDSIWVTYAPEEFQIERLTRKRDLTRDEAIMRIHSQGLQSDKVDRADLVIRNTGSFEELWKQVTTAWKGISSTDQSVPAIAQKEPDGKFSVHRGGPRDSEIIAELVTRLSNGEKSMTKADIMEAFGDKAFLLLMRGDNAIGLSGWQVENLVARTTDILIEPEFANESSLAILLQEVEKASQDLQCEVSLVFPLDALAALNTVWNDLGYEKRAPDSLGVQAWQDAARESMPAGSVLMFKQLRSDRVLRPI